MHHAGVNVDSLALDLVGPSTVVADASDDSTDITAGHRDGLAIVKGLDGGEEINVLLSDVGKLQHKVGARVGRDVGAPCGVEGLAGGSNGKIDILLSALADLADDLLGGRVNDVELLLVDTLNPLAVDVAGRNSVSILIHGRIVEKR